MEETWESWYVHTEMDHDEEFLDMCHTDDEEFLREILLQEPDFTKSDEIDHSLLHNNNNPTTTVEATSTTAAADDGVIVPLEEMSHHMVKSNSSNSIQNQQQQHGGTKVKRPRNSSTTTTPRTYILSFDDSTMIPITPEPQNNNYDQLLLGNDGTTRSNPNPTLPSKKRSQDPELKLNNQEGAKRARNSSQNMDHIIAERKRRQELTERFIALSATIPGLNKTDKASILRAAINYVKQLQDRVQDLEKEHKNSDANNAEIVIKRSNLYANDEDSTTTSETSFEGCCTLPEIEARVLGTDILIEIHCEKENGIELKILNHLENLQLWVTGTSVLPFGNSTLGITIIAQMSNAFKIAVNVLVKNLRKVILKSCKSDPY